MASRDLPDSGHSLTDKCNISIMIYTHAIPSYAILDNFSLQETDVLFTPRKIKFSSLALMKVVMMVVVNSYVMCIVLIM